jgi:hypothetical protein
MNSPVIHSPAATAAAAICNGTALFISFMTPDSDVYVEEPVKCIPTKLVVAGIKKSQALADAQLANIPG